MPSPTGPRLARRHRHAHDSRVATAARYFSRKRGLAAYMAAGSMSSVLDELTDALEAAGYSVATVHGYVRCARHVTYAMEHRQLARWQVTPAGLREFARVHHDSCRCPRSGLGGACNLRSCMTHLLPILQRRGLAAAAPPRAPFEGLLSDFDAYLAEVRGASESTRSLTRRALVPVLSALTRRGRFDVARLTGPALQGYVVATAERRAPATVTRVVVAIRSLLRFLQARGLATGTALATIKGARRQRFRPSQKALTPPQLRALLAPLRQGQDPIRMRDLAILLLLAQVGLRRGDVAGLHLQDLDARSGTLTVRRSKSRRAFELPVPQDALDAVLRYVRHGRPEAKTSALFVTYAFPYDGAISAHAVSAVVERAFRRSGVQHASHGAHVLRHTLATQLVAARQPLKAVADVMRHKEIDTTAVYVRVDLDRLRAAARPWPERQRDARA